MTVQRQTRINNSNNDINPNQNICAEAVAKYLRCNHTRKYLHTVQDLLKASRKVWTVRSRRAMLKGATVNDIKKSITKKGNALAYIVIVEGHVLALDAKGHTVIDTDPRNHDSRTVLKIYGVYSKGSLEK